MIAVEVQKAVTDQVAMDLVATVHHQDQMFRQEVKFQNLLMIFLSKVI